MKQKLFLSFLIFITTNISVSSADNTNSQLEKNKSIVKAFYELAFNEHKPKEAMEKFVGDTYIQHNPFVANGKKPFIDFFVPYFKEHPEAKVQIKRMIAENDLVVVHVHSQPKANDLGSAVVDIFRVKDGKIVEHWDTVQAVQEHPLNSNTMF